MFNRTISSRLFMIISIPLVLQVGFLCAYSQLLQQTEQLTASEAHSKEVVEHVHCLTALVTMTGFSALQYGVTQDEDYVKFRGMFGGMVSQELDALRRLYGKSDSEQKLINELAGSSQKLMTVCDGALTGGNPADGLSKLRCPTVKPNWKAFFATRQLLLEKEKARGDALTANVISARKLVNNAIGAAITGDIVLAIWLMWLTTRGIVSRLRVVTENADRFANGKDMHSPLKPGTDEISKLDQSFHTMAAALKAALEREFMQARTDALTALPNRRYFLETATKQFDIARRYDTPFCILIADIDHFKAINDKHGHPTGDEALKVISQALQTVARKADILARWGGEEFIIALPNTDLDGCGMFAERLRTMVLESEFTSDDGEKIPLTISIGCVLSAGLEWDDCIKLADDALYRAKKDGRNRVAMASDNQTVTQAF